MQMPNCGRIKYIFANHSLFSLFSPCLHESGFWICRKRGNYILVVWNGCSRGVCCSETANLLYIGTEAANKMPAHWHTHSQNCTSSAQLTVGSKVNKAKLNEKCLSDHPGCLPHTCIWWTAPTPSFLFPCVYNKQTLPVSFCWLSWKKKWSKIKKTISGLNAMAVQP